MRRTVEVIAEFFNSGNISEAERVLDEYAAYMVRIQMPLVSVGQMAELTNAMQAALDEACYGPLPTASGDSEPTG